MSGRKSLSILLFLAIALSAMVICGCEDNTDKLFSLLAQQVQNPDPANRSADVAVTTNLNWDVASLAESYDVYFSTSQAALENATTASSEFKGSVSTPTFDPSTVGNLGYGTAYYWRVDSVNLHGTTKGQVWSFATESAPAGAPDKVTSPAPSDGATDVSLGQVLSWAAAAGAESYDVYVGTDQAAVSSATTSSTRFVGNTTSVSYDPAGLDYSTTYYWRIDSVNFVDTTMGDVYQFTAESQALPAKVGSGLPSDGASGVPVAQVLFWGFAWRAQSYDVYLGTGQAALTGATTSSTQFMDNTAGLTYDPAGLDYSTTYYWRIDSVNSGGRAKGDVWQFTTATAPTTPPAKVATGVPSDGAGDMPIGQMLSWVGTSGAESYDVYLGTVQANVDSATTSSGEFAGNTTSLSHDPGGLNTSTTYYWRVDSVNSAGTTRGDVWSFSTAGAPGADFIGTPASGVTPLTISFSEACTGVITTYEWDFENDGTFDAFTQDATNIYSTAGTFSVKLRVSGPGGTDEIVKADYIRAYIPVGADFTGDPISGPAPLAVSFTGACTGTITTYEWDFENDGTFDAFTQDATHIYSMAGTFSVKFKATGPGGTGEIVRNNYITTYTPPEADFIAAPTIGTSPLTVSFTGACTGVITTYEWDFEDNGTFDAFTQDASCIYTDLGFYTVKLRVSGPGGEDTESKTNLIRVVDGLTIVTRRLPYAQVNVPYSETLQAYGGAPPYSWQVVAGLLPNGLNLNATGVISGTPTNTFAPSFMVEVTDSLTDTATQLLAIKVDMQNTVRVTVAKDGTADFTTISDALASLPDPLNASYVVEILDSGTYHENISITADTAGNWFTLRSTYNRLATIEAADPDSHAIFIGVWRVSIERVRICGASSSGCAGVKVGPGGMGVSVRNCVVFNNDIAIDTGNGPGMWLTANTCYGPKGISASGGGSAALFNNIVYSTGGPADWCIFSMMCSADYNLYYAPSGNVGFDGTSYYATLAQWQAFMGEANSRYGDPNFRGIGGSDFHLTDSSTEAIDNGNVALAGPGGPLILDAEGFARPQGLGLDIGAYEHK